MECSVCYCVLTLKNIVNTECNHVYCKDCFWKWTKENNNCPMCRTPICRPPENDGDNFNFINE